MSCPICSGQFFLSKDALRRIVGCSNCGSKVLPIGMSEKEFVRRVLERNNMKRTVTDCDHCGKETPTRNVDLATDRRTDAAGSSEMIYEDVDLCLDCLYLAVINLLKDLSYEDAREWLKTARSGAKRI